MENKAERYPIDYDAVKMGDSWSDSDIAKIYDVPENDKNFHWVKLNFTESLKNELWLRGKNWTVAQVNSLVRVLTDGESTIYHRKAAKSGCKKIFKSAECLTYVDTADFTDEQKRDHDRGLIEVAYYCAGLKRSIRQYKKHFSLIRERPSIPGCVDDDEED